MVSCGRRRKIYAELDNYSLCFCAAMKRMELLVSWVSDAVFVAVVSFVDIDDDDNVSGLDVVAHFEPTGVEGRSFFFGASSGVGGLQTDPAFFLVVKRGDVDSLQSPVVVLVLGK
jgi:hypothetical protein